MSRSRGANLRIAAAFVVLAALTAISIIWRRSIVRRGEETSRAGVVGAASGARPLVSIVIDDFGYVDTTVINGFVSLPVPLTAAVLPFEMQTRFSAEAAYRMGKEVIVHLPMQGHDGSDPGPRAILDSLSEADTRSRTRRALRDVPFAVGVNNHMGSVITADTMRMRWILEEVGAMRFFFIDSRTTSKTVAESMAKEMHIRTTSRQVFLDDSKSRADIEAEWSRAMRIARHAGRVLVIGHVYPETLAALRELMPRDSGVVRFVTASELVR